MRAVEVLTEAQLVVGRIVCLPQDAATLQSFAAAMKLFATAKTLPWEGLFCFGRAVRPGLGVARSRSAVSALRATIPHPSANELLAGGTSQAAMPLGIEDEIGFWALQSVNVQLLFDYEEPGRDSSAVRRDERVPAACRRFPAFSRNCRKFSGHSFLRENRNDYPMRGNKTARAHQRRRGQNGGILAQRNMQ